MTTQTQVSEKPVSHAAEKKRFPRLSGMVDRFSNWSEARSERKAGERDMRRTCNGAMATLAYVYANPRGEESGLPEEMESDLRIGRRYPAPKECIKEVADAYFKLDDSHKQEVVAFITKKLGQNAPYALDKLEASESVIAIAASISGIAKRLPVDEEGDKDVAAFEKAISILETLAKPEQLFQTDPEQYASMRLSCTDALWSLDYGDTDFWLSRLNDGVTKSFTLGHLLEMPPTKDPDSHGWCLLRSKLTELSVDIARHESMKKFDFLIDTLKTGKEEDVLNTLRAAAYVPIPLFIRDEKHEDFQEDAAYQRAHFTLYDTIASLSDRRPISEDAAKLVLTFQVSVDAQIALTYTDDRQFAGALKLLMVYNADQDLNSHLRPLLLETGAEMVSVCREPSGASDQSEEDASACQQKALQVLVQFHKSGIAVPGLMVKKAGETCTYAVTVG